MPQNIIRQRLSGVILHPSSLPGNQPHGSFGLHALRWIDWLHDAGFRVWQVLPLTPVSDGSPYNSYSAFSGNPNFIDINTLKEQGFPAIEGIDESHTTTISFEQQQQHLHTSFQWLLKNPESPLYHQWQAFIQQSPWLHDACLFSVLKKLYPVHWVEWPEAFKNRNPQALCDIKKSHQHDVEFQQFLQFLFYAQWQRIRDYAHQKSISLLGDMPIFVAHDSVDVWANRSLYKLNDDGNPIVVAGVPPDYFSATGQHWGNPIYHWPHHEQQQFQWWADRIQHSLSQFDAVRIDHFRGFDACWEIPANEETAINGNWAPAPGEHLFDRLMKDNPDLPLIAEDLGIITEAVIRLRKKYRFPGMKILQFAFDSDSKNPYLPHNHSKDAIIYTGTHDNNTTLGWYHHLNPQQQEHIQNYYAHPAEPMPWPFIKSALASPAGWAIIPLQDLLMLDESHRMNTPGTTHGNWRWRFQWSQVENTLPAQLHSLNALYQR